MDVHEVLGAMKEKHRVVLLLKEVDGMTAEQIGHAFEPFYTTRPVGSGVGLGLATARNVVQAHSGRISLDSQPDVGTTVSLFFPTPP